MADQIHLNKFRQCAFQKDADSWNAWRRHIAVIDLSDTNLKDLWKNIFDAVYCRGFDLSSVNFKRTDLSHARFREVKDFVHSDFTDCDLRGAWFVDCDLGAVCLTNANVRGAKFERTTLGGLCGEAKNLNEATFEKTRFVGAWTDHTFENMMFEKCAFFGCRWENIKFVNCVFDECKYEDAEILHSVFKGCNMGGEDLRFVNFTNCIFTSNTHLGSARLDRSILVDTDLMGSILDSSTSFNGAKVSRCKIARQQLESLTNYGGLTKGDRMSMTIIDPVARLRSAYSGFWQWFHVIALLVFLFPYVWFLFSQWTVARFIGYEPTDTIPLGIALARFIFNGGIQWQSGFQFHFSFLLFMFMMVYNSMRGIFLWKTKQLELVEQSSGLPAKFSFGTYRFEWGWWFMWANRLGLLYLAIGVLNFLHFLRMEIPLIVE